jgi:hypothetical protein
MGQSRHFDRAPLTSGFPQKQTFSASFVMSQKCHHRKSDDLSITSSAHSCSTKHLGFVEQKASGVLVIVRP